MDTIGYCFECGMSKGVLVLFICCQNNLNVLTRYGGNTFAVIAHITVEALQRCVLCHQCRTV